MAIRVFAAELTSASGMFYSKPKFSEKPRDKTHDIYERESWQEKVHVTDNGDCCLNAMAIKNCLETAAVRLSMKVPGERNKTFSKLFRSGILVLETPIMLNPATSKPYTIDDVNPRMMFVPADGKRGSAKRVNRIFPELTTWKTNVSITVMDDKIPDEIMLEHLQQAGLFIGLGAMRVENGGISGRFKVTKFKLVEGKTIGTPAVI